MLFKATSNNKRNTPRTEALCRYGERCWPAALIWISAICAGNICSPGLWSMPEVCEEIGQGGSETQTPRQHVCQTQFKLTPTEKIEALTANAGMPFKQSACVCVPYSASLKTSIWNVKEGSHSVVISMCKQRRHMWCVIWDFFILPGESSPCSVNNGGCHDLCFLTPLGVVNCSCRGERILLDDNRCVCKSCILSPFLCLSLFLSQLSCELISRTHPNVFLTPELD